MVRRPRIRQPKAAPPAAPSKDTKPEPTGLPKPVVPRQDEDPDVAAARKAVEQFENERRVLHEMVADWVTNFPEAHLARQEILEQEDIVNAAIAKAKPLVAKAKQSIGDFTATRKYKNAHYDESEVMRILSSLENRLELINEMIDSGVVKALSLDTDATIAWFAQRPGYASTFQPAFKERAEQTCAVGVPKVPKA